MTIPVGIRGMGERSQPPRLGKIRLGRLVKNKNGEGTHPERSDHFVTDDNEHGQRLREWLETEKPTRLPIRFVSDDPAECAPYNLEMWGNGTLKCRGNGEVADAMAVVSVLETWRRTSDGDTPPPPDLWARTSIPQRGQPEPERRRIPCFGSGYDGAPPCPMYGARNGCSPTMHMLYVIRGYPGGLGVWQTDTNSVVNIDRVHAFLKFLQMLPGARISDVPLVLSMEERQMRGQTYHFLRLDVDVDEMQNVGALTAAAPAPLAIEAPDIEDLAGTVPEPLEDEPEVDPDTPAEEVAEPTVEQLEQARAWIAEQEQRYGLKEADVLHNAGVVHVVHLALDFDACRARFETAAEEAKRVGGDTQETEAAQGELVEPDIRNRADLFTWAGNSYGKKPVDILTTYSISAMPELDDLAEKDGGWNAMRDFLAGLWRDEVRA